MESWPINTYPFLAVLPSGAVLVIAGMPYVTHALLFVDMALDYSLLLQAL